MIEAIILFIRLLNKKESADQAHVYVPAERKPKFEEPFKQLEQPITEISPSIESTNEIITKEPINDEQEPMGVNLKADSIIVKEQPINMSTFQQNNTLTIDKNTKPKLTNEDLNNFRKSISYVSKII